MIKIYLILSLLFTFLGFSQDNSALFEAGKSPSLEAMKRTYNRAILNGGVTQDFSANTENIREISRDLNYNILKDATFVYVPSSYGEGKNFGQFSTNAITDSDFTFTRATSATVTNKLGVIEDSCYNLFLNSTLIGGGTTPTNWTLGFGGGASTPESILINNNTAYRFTTTSNRQLWYQSKQQYSGTYYLISVYVESVTTPINVNQLLFNNGTSASQTFYADGVLISGATPIVAGKRYSSVSLANTTEVTQIRIGCGCVGNATGDFILSRPQFEQGSTLRPYLRTTTRLAVPRLDYSRSLTEPSLLIEPQSTNLLLNSATGTTQNITTTATPYTLSIYGTGTYTLSGSYSGSLVGSGSGRSTLTFTPAAGTLTLTASGTMTNVQLENRGSVTTYIPTTSTSVTRNGETSYVDLFNNDLLNDTTFTLFWEGYLNYGETNPAAYTFSFGLSDTTSSTLTGNKVGWMSNLLPSYISGGVGGSYTGGVSNLTYNKFAIQYDNGVADYYVNGVNVAASTALAVFDYRYLILNTGGSTYATNKIALFNRTLSDTECTNLTTP